MKIKDERRYVLLSVKWCRNGTLVFWGKRTADDEEMNIAIPVSRWRKYDRNWAIDYKTPRELESLRNLNKFEVFLMELKQSYSEVIIDMRYETSEVLPEARPEASFY